MKVISLQVGLPRKVSYQGNEIETGIFKDVIPGPVRVNTFNLVGDKQADLTVHGGRDKAVYAFGADTFPWWSKVRPQDSYAPGSFGENLTLDSLDESQVFIGDVYEVGTVLLQVTQPRFPCFKLGIKFNDPSILKTFIQSKRPGVYYRVLREGDIAVGDEMKLVDQEAVKASVQELFLIKKVEPARAERLQELLQIKSLNPDWKKKFEKWLTEAN